MKQEKQDFKRGRQIIVRTLKQWFDEEDIHGDIKGTWKGTPMIHFPFGSITLERNHWRFSLNFTPMDSPWDAQMLLILMQALHSKGINLEMYEPFYTVHIEDGTCCGSIFESEVLKFAKKMKVSEEGAFDILRGQMIDEYNEEHGAH